MSSTLSIAASKLCTILDINVLTCSLDRHRNAATALIRVLKFDDSRTTLVIVVIASLGMVNVAFMNALPRA